MCMYMFRRQEEERHQQEEDKRRQEAECLLHNQLKWVNSDHKDNRFIHLLSANVQSLCILMVFLKKAPKNIVILHSWVIGTVA